MEEKETNPTDKYPAPFVIKTKINYPATIISLAIGLALGFFIYSVLPVQKENTSSSITLKPLSKLVLPPEAVQIQQCADGKGSLYIKPKDIPNGPAYMVNNGDVIGIEFMLQKDEFLKGHDWKNLKGFGAELDHVNISLSTEGHEGYIFPHYDVSLFVVSSEYEKGIKCQPVSSTISPKK